MIEAVKDACFVLLFEPDKDDVLTNVDPKLASKGAQKFIKN